VDYRLTDFLPTTKKELELRGWDYVDVILFSGDAYVDHPSFGAAVIGRTLEAAGYRVAIVPQPDWHGDYRDFKKLGTPRLFFGIAPGCMDSMVNKYTANRRLRSEDAYSPDGRHDMRPEYPTIVYSRILRQLFPRVPIILGGIEASMRRLTHYDYWQDRLRPCILCDAPADLIVYGMGEKPILEIANRLDASCSDATAVASLNGSVPGGSLDGSVAGGSLDGSVAACSPKGSVAGGSLEGSVTGGCASSILRDIPQTVYLADCITPTADDIVLHSHDACLRDKRKQAENFRHIEEQSNMMHAHRLIQEVGGEIVNRKSENRKSFVVVNPPYPPMTTAELDASFDLPYTRQPHPKYKGKRIPAYEMIKHSINIHRGCFGGCAFCTISAHQGKFITCRSKESILKEVRQVMQMPDFRGYLSDLGGPSANMYGMKGRNVNACEHCKRPSCIHPQVCPNLDTNHSALLDIYRAVDALPGIKKSFIGSGVRYDLILHHSKDEASNRAAMDYARELITRHVSGRLKVAPEHTSDRVLNYMRKPSFQLFYDFKRLFDHICREEHLNQQLIPYFISSHPGCTEADMAQLAEITRQLNFHLEQVQDFTPTPMTISTETWYTGYDPYTLEKVYSARSPKEKLAQRQYFFWYKDAEHPSPNTHHPTPNTHHDHHRTNARPQESHKEKRGRHRRHP